MSGAIKTAHIASKRDFIFETAEILIKAAPRPARWFADRFRANAEKVKIERC